MLIQTKNMLTKLLTPLTFFLFANLLSAQVPKQVVVEHFTNTRCSICANRNPGFFTNLDNQTDVLHLAYHPSSPYSNCIFSQHNPNENDARTNYYGIYGGTPRLVIQGDVVPSSQDYSSNSIFSSHTGEMTPVSISIEQTWDGTDSIQVRAVIKREAAGSLGTLRLFVGLFERFIDYDAPNGESGHHNVFRKGLSTMSGLTVNLPTTVGDSVVFQNKVSAESEWVQTEIYAAAILQEESSKELVQAKAVDISQNPLVGIRNIEDDLEWNVFPNPSSDFVSVNLKENTESVLRLFDLNGKLLFETVFNQKANISLEGFNQGQYLILVTNEKGRAMKKVLKF